MTDVLRYAAFAEVPGGGNPAGIVLDPTGPGGAPWDEAAMVAVAADVGYSETAFVVADDGDRRLGLRYASPRTEVPFCGHATVATAVALAERRGPGAYVFDTPAGEIELDTAVREDGRLVATFTSVPTRSRPATDAEVSDTLLALGWVRPELDERYPPHVAFGGVEHLVLATATPARLADLTYEMDVLGQVMAEHGWTTVQLVHDLGDGTYLARDPFPPGGVVEDPATGAAAAAFGGYLLATGLAPDSGRVTIRQGEAMGRPSVLTVDLTRGDGRVRVSGAAVPMPE